jgi:hypothetical protein
MSIKTDHIALEEHIDNVVSIITFDDIAKCRATCQAQTTRKSYEHHQQNAMATVIGQSSC